MQIEPSPHPRIAQRKANLRTGLILGSIALMFFAGFVVKMFLLGK